LESFAVAQRCAALARQVDFQQVLHTMADRIEKAPWN
jgi:hypothetical protein